MVVVVGEGGPAALRQGGVTLSWGNNLVPIRHSAPVGEETGRRAGLRGPVRLESRCDAGRSNRGCVARARGTLSSDAARPKECRLLPIWKSAGKRMQGATPNIWRGFRIVSVHRSEYGGSSLSLWCAGRAGPARTTRTGRDSSGQAPIALWVTRRGAGSRQAHADQDDT